MIKEISLLGEALVVRELILRPASKEPAEALAVFQRHVAERHGITELRGLLWENYLALFESDPVMADLLAYMGLL